MNLQPRSFAPFLGAAIAVCASAQYQSSNVSLYRQYSLSALGAGSGNGCWGYVSPSGREYALMGLNNKTAFVEITDPTNSNFFTSIPHSSSTWSDIKTYRNYAYVCTEASGSGIQVIDLSNIDNGQVTLVRTIASPGRSHTIHVDNTSGFLYTCGSNEGTGTTMCFSLADPSNPVRVGANTMTPVYQHEIQMHTYTSGPYAGKQVMFGNGEGRGLEIWDVTNKDNPTLMRRVTYPMVGYCHQGWLSPDLRYYYVNDEFDESNNNIATRTLVFDVSVLASAELVSTFSSGRPSIDHNLYQKNWFVFESNYTSGLRIFDLNANPTNPTQVGWFDTYPANDNPSFNGTWSNYPLFPSGTVIVSDINRGLFILNVEDATVKPRAITSATLDRGATVSGSVSNLGTTDQSYWVVKKGITGNSSEAPIQAVFEATSLWQDLTKVRFTTRHKVNSTGLSQTIELFDWTANQYVVVGNASAPTSDTSFTVVGSSPDRFVQAGTMKMKARVSFKATAPVSVQDWQASFDQVEFKINP